jgi:hypothetical protein
VNPVSRQPYRYDAFISYSHRNRDWVHNWLVPRLKHAGLKVCIDSESFEPGAPSLTEMERAVLRSRKTVLLLTPEYLQSGWTEFENILVQTLDPAAHQRRLIPVLLLPGWFFRTPPGLAQSPCIRATVEEAQPRASLFDRSASGYRGGRYR